MENRNVLLVRCPDEKGLVYKIMGLLFKRDLNVIENTETVDRVSHTFYMRTEFTGEVPAAELLKDLRPLLPAAAHLQLRPQTAKRLVLLATKETHCLGDLLLRHQAGEL